MARARATFEAAEFRGGVLEVSRKREDGIGSRYDYGRIYERGTDGEEGKGEKREKLEEKDVHRQGWERRRWVRGAFDAKGEAKGWSQLGRRPIEVDACADIPSYFMPQAGSSSRPR